MQHDDKIKKLFTSKLSNFEIDAPANVWEQIDRSLPTAKVAVAKKIVLRRVMSLSAGVAAILILGFIFLNKNSDVAKQLVLDIPVEEHHPIGISEKKGLEDNSDQSFIESAVVKKENKQLYSSSLSNTLHLEVIPDTNNTHQVKPVNDDDITDNTVTTENIPASNESTDNISDKKKEKEKVTTYNLFNQNSTTPYINIPQRKKGKGISISVDGHSGFTRQSNSGTSTPQVFLKYASMDQSDVNTVASENAESENNRKDLIKMEHKQPISIGLKVNKELNNNISIETGVVYSYLSSKIKPTRPADVQIEGTQKLHYIGIPVTLNYTFARLERFEFYVSGGGMVQKDVSGKLEGDQEIKNMYQESSTTTIKDEISQNNLQFSLMANAGVSYPIYDKLSIYATVGGAYYFDANNEYQTIYSDKKLQLDVNVGLKIKF